MDASPENDARPGPWMPIGWALAAAVVTAVSVAGVGILGMNSESAGMEAANLAALPLGFVCSAAPVALVVHFLVKRGPARVAAPVGCGCLGGIGLLAGLFVFWSAIWPSL